MDRLRIAPLIGTPSEAAEASIIAFVAERVRIGAVDRMAGALD